MDAIRLCALTQIFQLQRVQLQREIFCLRGDFLQVVFHCAPRKPAVGIIAKRGFQLRRQTPFPQRARRNGSTTDTARFTLNLRTWRESVRAEVGRVVELQPVFDPGRATHDD